MNDATQIVRERATALLADGTVAAVVGWAAGRGDHDRHVFVARTPEEAALLVADQYCGALAAKRVLSLLDEGKIALVARGCESRAVNRFMADRQLKRDQVHIIGWPCPGMLDPATGDALKRCTECQRRNPVLSDEVVGDPVPEPELDRFAELERFEQKTPEERRAFFQDMYESCIRCYACRNACPCCTCRVCFVDQERVGWMGEEFTADEARYYGTVRAFHTGDRCIECGECQRVCPQHLPLMLLMHKQVRDIDGLFGPYPGGGMEPEGPDPLRTYHTDDLEEFM
ncbi:MAG: hypothetical protein SOI38_00185 [Eggerthellaceae bacterium]|jgi:formate dehydrogenase subunit beta